jgi:hypothetical protein
MFPVKLLLTLIALAIAGGTRHPLAYLLAVALPLLLWWPAPKS